MAKCHTECFIFDKFLKVNNYSSNNSHSIIVYITVDPNSNIVNIVVNGIDNVMFVMIKNKHTTANISIVIHHNTNNGFLSPLFICLQILYHLLHIPG